VTFAPPVDANAVERPIDRAIHTDRQEAVEISPACATHPVSAFVALAVVPRSKPARNPMRLSVSNSVR